MTWVAGADGCKGGWVIVLRELGSGRIRIREAREIAEVLRWRESPKVLCVDVPIGLLDNAVPGGRVCDKEARALLKRPRASSVFSPPARRTLAAKSYKEALVLNRRTSKPLEVGISKQCFGIFDKLREMELLMTPSRQKRILEAHPEVCFYQMNRCGPLVEPKRKASGRNRRVRLLEKAWGRKVVEEIEAHRSATAARDDIIDAMAACWSAERVLRKQEIHLPGKQVLRDSRGLRMEIVC